MKIQLSFKLKTIRTPLLSLVACAALSVSITGCDLAKNHLKADREGGMEVQDYRDALSSRVQDDDDSDWSSSAPSLQPYIAQSSETMKAMPLVSVSVNQSVPLRDLLYELAEQAEYDLELDPRIRGAIIFTARERPFDLVIKRIASIAGLRYKFEDDILRVELDTSYNQLYKIDYLAYVRSNSSTISADISVVQGEGAQAGSGFSTSAESESNFWEELDGNIAQIIGGANNNHLRTSRTPQITATAQNPDVVSGADGGEPAQAVVNVSSLPTEEEPEDEASGNADDDPNAPTYTINKQAGIVNVFAPEKTQKEVAEYLRLVKRSVTAQVLIETKILEVSLNDEFSTGIDWNSLNAGSNNVLAQFTGVGSNVGLTDSLQTIGRDASSVFTGSNNFFVSVSDKVDVLIQALSGYGTVKALASPRLTVVNNQSAVLNVSTNRVFFEVDIDVSDTDSGVTTEISSTVNSVPEGVLIHVLPSINLDDRTVSLAVRPTITEVVNRIEDPAVQYITAANSITGVTSEFPELNVQEIDSVIKVDSGRPIVMGGLLQDRVQGVQEGIPVLSEIPLAGALFRDQNDLITKTEVVIFMKATILDSPSDSVHATDKDLYRKFSSDRRPLRF